MKYLIFLLSIALVNCVGKANENNSADKKITNLKDTGIHNKDSFNLVYLLNRYGEANVFTALYFIDKNSISTDSVKLDSSAVFYCQIHSFLGRPDSKNVSLQAVENYFKKVAIEKQKQILNNLKQWLKNDILLTSVLDNNLSENVFFEEIIFDIPETKHYVTQYLKNPNQYWGSLDENQACKLYYDVSLYLLTLDTPSRLNFFSQYFTIACKIASFDTGSNGEKEQ